MNQLLTFTATIASSSPVLDGTKVAFYAGKILLGTGLTSGGAATFTTSSWTVGSYTVRATYPGDLTHQGSSGTVPQTVTGYPTATALFSSLNPSIYGQSVSWTAQVTSAGLLPPPGAVAFNWSDGFRTFTIGTTPLNSSGVAMLTKSNLNADPFR